MKEKLKQWQLPNNSKVRLSDGTEITFLKMDGMYAKWDQEGRFATGNFEAFEKRDGYYQVV